MQESIGNNCRSGNSSGSFCRTFVTLLEAHLRPGAFSMSRTFRTLALSAALLATMTGSAFASGPGGTNPPPKGSFFCYVLSFFGY
jgi:hypothetical protein